MAQRQRNQRGEGAYLRVELIQAAMRLLDRAPASELSLRMVAKEAGVAAPSVYAHFADAKTMFAEIVRECWNQMAEVMADGARQAPDDPYAQLRAEMSAYVQYAMERPSRYQLLFALRPMDTGSLPDLPGLLQPAYRKVLACVEQLAPRGSAKRDTMADTILVISIAHGRIALAHLAPHRSGNSAAGVTKFVLDALAQIFEP